MSRIAIPIIIKEIPEKYLISPNFGKENAIKTPVAMDKIMTIQITLNEF